MFSNDTKLMSFLLAALTVLRGEDFFDTELNKLVALMSVLLIRWLYWTDITSDTWNIV